MTPVAKPFLPPKEEYDSIISTIWDSQWLTNSGPIASELEKRLSDKLKVKNLLFVSNGTIALQLSIKALNLEGEIITTPFSFVATTSSICWEQCSPVFVDIDKNTLNIDPSKIEEAITPNTSAILATHVYGNSCDVVAIEEIANKHNLKVIYDGAHAFGVEINGKSIFEYGDITICSTHATKIYHTVEGGLIVTKDKDLHHKIKSMRNFGFKNEVSFEYLGTNAKNSEFHAAMGLVNLNHFSSNWNKRQQLSLLYDSLLKGIIKKQIWNDDTSFAYSYYPVIFNTEAELLEVQSSLKQNNIIARRYFYPLLSSSLPYVSENETLPIADSISKKILCLPLFFDLSEDTVREISEIIQMVLNSEKAWVL